MQNELFLVPAPKRVAYREGSFTLNLTGYLSIDAPELYDIAKRVQKAFGGRLKICVGEASCPAQIRFVKNAALGGQGYEITVDETGVLVAYAKACGAFYACQTLGQMFACKKNVLPFVKICDWPDFETRGYMLDVGRNRVPTMQTLRRLVDLLAQFKINQLQLYMESFAFEYPSFPNVWAGCGALSGEDILDLSAYCRQNYIDLVPCQNHFGHMQGWLAKEEYRHLAECPDGFTFEGWLLEPRCLNPQNPESFALVKQMIEDLLPYFSSRFFNICCDETLELGQGKSKAACEAASVGRVYLDFVLKIYEMAKEKGKTIQFWGDIILHYPELLPDMPKDAIALNWGYNPDQPSEESCRAFAESGVPFFVCPGTGAWNCLLGRTSQMFENIARAARNGKKFGAIGLLNTDWGDEGHMQSISSSYAGLTYGAAVSWGVCENEKMDLAKALDRYVFGDQSGTFGQFVLDIGNYYLHEGRSINNITSTMVILNAGAKNHGAIGELEDANFLETDAYIQSLSGMPDKALLTCSDAEKVLSEYRFYMRLVRHGLKLGRYHAAAKAQNVPQQKAFLCELSREISCIIKDFEQIWSGRSKIGGMEATCGRLRALRQDYGELLAELK